MKELRRSDVRRGLVAVLIFLTLVFSFGCFREYYRAKEKPYTEFRTSVENEKYDKYIIVHLHEKALQLSDIILGEQSISGSLFPVDEDHLFYLKTKPSGVNAYRGNKEKQVLNEVHIWLKSNVDITEDEFASGEQLLVHTDQVDRIEFYELDRESTIGSHVLSSIGVGLSIAIVVALLASSGSSSPSPPVASGTDGSCPFVYAFDGQAFQLEGELFAGALLPNLERDDYLALSGNHPYDGRQVVRLKNELQEVQYINLAELIAVNHAPGVRVLPDQAGRPHSVKNQQPARAAFTANGQPVLPLVDTADRVPFIFNEQEVEDNALVLHFDRPQGAPAGKLVVRAKNTQWMELMWYEFNRRYGSFYENWVSYMGNRATESLEAWMEDQQLMLTVELLTDDGWKPVERLPFVGPLAWRDLVVPVDLSGCPADEVRLRLRSGFLFWEIDYAAMDFSEDQPFEVTVSQLLRAPANDGRDYTAPLSAADTSYLRQASVGEVVDLCFPVVPVDDGQVQTLILHSRGHYHPLRAFSGLPQVMELWKFRQPDHFPKFSQDHFQAFLEEQGIRLAEVSSVN